jgi:hypothetical protein
MRPSFHGLVTVRRDSADNLGQVAPLLENIRSAMSTPRGGRQVCLVCGRSVSGAEDSLKLRGGAVVHRRCATYDTRRRRTDSQQRLD